jgi:hypothetical protein
MQRLLPLFVMFGCGPAARLVDVTSTTIGSSKKDVMSRSPSLVRDQQLAEKYVAKVAVSKATGDACAG